MYAYVGNFQLTSGALERLAAGEERFLQQLQEVKGFQGAYGLHREDMSDVLLVTLFETEQDARNYGESYVRLEADELLGQAAEGQGRDSIHEVIFHVARP